MSNLTETVELLQREIQQLKDTQQVNDAQNEENLNSVRNSKLEIFSISYIGIRWKDLKVGYLFISPCFSGGKLESCLQLKTFQFLDLSNFKLSNFSIFPT